MVTGKGGHSDLCLIDLIDGVVVDRIGDVLTGVLRAIADPAEDAETRSGGSIGVNVNYFAALDILEKSHRSVARVVLDHVGVVLALAHVEARVLEDAALSISAFGGVVEEVFADGCKVLSAESFLFLQLFLPVGKTAALLLLTVLAVLTVKPESAQLGLDLLLPTILSLNS